MSGACGANIDIQDAASTAEGAAWSGACGASRRHAAGEVAA